MRSNSEWQQVIACRITEESYPHCLSTQANAMDGHAVSYDQSGKFGGT